MVLELDTSWCVSEDAPKGGGGVDCETTNASEDAKPRRGVDSEIPHRLEILYKSVKIFLVDAFLNLERKPRRESPKRTIFVSDELGLLPSLQVSTHSTIRLLKSSYYQSRFGFRNVI